MKLNENKRKDYSIKLPIKPIDGLLGVQDSSDIDFSYSSQILSGSLTTTGVTAGTYGDGTHVAQITVDSKGRITGITNVSITGGGGSAAWGSIGAGTGVGSQADLVAYLTANYYQIPTGTILQYIRGDGSLATFPTIPTVGTWGALNYPTWTSGTPFVKMTAAGTFALDTNTYFQNSMTTNRILGRSTASTGAVEELTASKTVTINSGNVELVNDQATPAYPGVYGIDAAGNKNWRSDTSVRGDIPLAWMQESYITTTNQTGVLYVPSVSKLYVCNNTSNTITIYDTTNGTLLATLANIGAFQAFYIASINEIWVTSSSLTTINRISPSSNSSLGTITGATANGVECVEYSSTKVYISVQNATGRIMILDPSTLSVTTSITLNVPSNPVGMCLNTNASSAQYDHIILSCGGGVAIYDPTTDAITTTLTNPSTSISSGRTIKYITSTDQYAIANPGNLNIVILDIASATTFTVNSTIRNMSGIQDLCVDETNGYIFTTVSGLTSANVLFMTIIDLTTKLVKLTIPTNVICGASTAAGKISLDQSNTRMFVCGRSSVANVVSAIKYV